jgi:hypothetical protein
MFGCNLSRTFGHLGRAELDDSDLPGMDDIKKYQSMIGALQWESRLELDVATAVMSMSASVSLLDKDILTALRGSMAISQNEAYAALRVRTGEPDYSDVEGRI